MATLVYEKEVTCPPSLAVQRIYHALGCEGMHETHYVLTVPFADLGLPDIGELSREVSVTIGDPMRKGSLTRIQLSWRVPHSDAFPVFQGFFEIQPLSSYEIQLALLGYYHAPLGMIGAVFDMVLGRRIAEATVRHLIDEISKSIEEPVTAKKVARIG
jgi:hypothetical protein